MAPCGTSERRHGARRSRLHHSLFGPVEPRSRVVFSLKLIIPLNLYRRHLNTIDRALLAQHLKKHP
jgi:hypothetical protein